MDTATVAQGMRGTIVGFGVAAAAVLALVPGARAGGPQLVLGATEDAVRAPTLVAAKAQMDLLTLAGFRAVRITQVWTPGQHELSAKDKTILRNVATAAKLDHVTVVTTIMNKGSATTPLTDSDQADFAAYAASVVAAVPDLQTVIVGNEPNLNRYWLPQFDDQGADVAATAYENLLAKTYDAIKAQSPSVTVLGGAVSPRGGDVGGGIRPTHSPTVFIRDLGTAWQASGRTTPIMDGFAFHPYEDNSSVAPVDGVHPNTTTIALADYQKLVDLLGQAFGDYQMPIWYDEFGVETQLPTSKQPLYTGTEPATTKPVDEATQAEYYTQAVQLAFCQPNVRALFLFHTVDETDLAAWQSGVYYADGTPKSSLLTVTEALDEARRGVVAQCPGLQLTVKPKVVARSGRFVLTCDLDCSYVAQLYKLPGHLIRSTRGVAIGSQPTSVPIRVPTTRGSYRLRLSAVASMNPGPAALRLASLSRR
jgi:hypothetical protein